MVLVTLVEHLTQRGTRRTRPRTVSRVRPEFGHRPVNLVECPNPLHSLAVLVQTVEVGPDAPVPRDPDQRLADDLVTSGGGPIRERLIARVGGGRAVRRRRADRTGRRPIKLAGTLSRRWTRFARTAALRRGSSSRYRFSPCLVLQTGPAGRDAARGAMPSRAPLAWLADVGGRDLSLDDASSARTGGWRLGAAAKRA
jgi:hypothetical protein